MWRDDPGSTVWTGAPQGVLFSQVSAGLPLRPRSASGCWPSSVRSGSATVTSARFGSTGSVMKSSGAGMVAVWAGGSRCRIEQRLSSPRWSPTEVGHHLPRVLCAGNSRVSSPHTLAVSCPAFGREWSDPRSRRWLPPDQLQTHPSGNPSSGTPRSVHQ